MKGTAFAFGGHVMCASSRRPIRAPSKNQGPPANSARRGRLGLGLALGSVLYGASCGFAQPANAEPLLRKPMVRLTGEYSHVRFPTSYSGKYRADGAATRFAIEQMATRPARGLRLEAGLIAHHEGVAGVPFLSVSVARLETRTVGLEIVGLEHTWRSHPWWWSVGLGAELQTLERMLCVSAELGVAGVSESVEPRQLGLSVEEESTFGALGRIAASLRIPIGEELALGGTAFAATYVLPSQSAVTRVGFGIFLEWNGGGA